MAEQKIAIEVLEQEIAVCVEAGVEEDDKLLNALRLVRDYLKDLVD